MDSGDAHYVNRLLVGTPATGLVRVEWFQSRVGMITPVNWSMVNMVQYMNSFIPLRYQVADAQNLIVREAIKGDFEWLFLLEHDVMMPPDGLIFLSEYLQERKYPVVSGLYYTRSRPSMPLLFRGRGTGAYLDWEMGDTVWVDGVPTGCLLIHVGLLRAMWEESEPYDLPYAGETVTTRRVFYTPRDIVGDPEGNYLSTLSGTSDLDWCTKVMDGEYFKKSGWDEYQDMEFPFPVDTRLFCKHIDMSGVQYP
jgi:hypothetical protein